MKTIISFGLCPFVQRSLITLNHKNVPYEVKYIDLENKPEWFLKISPLGKVPLLKEDDQVLFESSVINEYIDDSTNGSLLPSDPLLKAKDRAIIELSSSAIFNYFYAATSKSKEDYQKYKKELESNLTFLLNDFKGPFFHGAELSLVDTAAIPLFHRLILTGNMLNDLKIEEKLKDKINQWTEASLSLDEVKKSVPANFEDDFKNYLITKESYIALDHSLTA